MLADLLRSRLPDGTTSLRPVVAGSRGSTFPNCRPPKGTTVVSDPRTTFLCQVRSLGAKLELSGYMELYISGSTFCWEHLMATPVISFACTKGGVGKTTLAFVLATAYARRLSGSSEYRVSCIDADPNGTLDAALQRAAFTEILSLTSDAEMLLPRLREAQRAADLVMIDLEGSANQAMLYAAGKSDLIIIPAQPSAYDVREARKTAGVVQQAADLVQREIPMRVVLTRAPVLRQRVADHSRAQFEKANLPILPIELLQRTAFQTMTYTGEPPFMSDPGGGAAANVDALAEAVAALVGLRIAPHARRERAA